MTRIPSSDAPVTANNHDWNAVPAFDCFERNQASDLLNLDLVTALHKIRSCRPPAEVILCGESDDLSKSVLRLLLGRVSKTDVSGLLLLLARMASEQRDKN